MGAEQQLLQHVYEVLVQGQKPTTVQPTPDELNPKFTPNQKFLQAAVLNHLTGRALRLVRGARLPGAPAPGGREP